MCIDRQFASILFIFPGNWLHFPLRRFFKPSPTRMTFEGYILICTLRYIQFLNIKIQYKEFLAENFNAYFIYIYICNTENRVNRARYL